jgi:hypothetical protein
LCVTGATFTIALKLHWMKHRRRELPDRAGAA